MAIERSVTAVSHDLRHGENVWAVLCQAALRSIAWAADACGAREADERIERTELLVEHGTAPLGLGPPQRAPFEVLPGIDWAQLGEVDRAYVAHVIGANEPPLHRWW
jgi:hypothetical protein